MSAGLTLCSTLSLPSLRPWCQRSEFNNNTLCWRSGGDREEGGGQGGIKPPLLGQSSAAQRLQAATFRWGDKKHFNSYLLRAEPRFPFQLLEVHALCSGSPKVQMWRIKWQKAGGRCACVWEDRTLCTRRMDMQICKYALFSLPTFGLISWYFWG